jgi:hypothetical protein
MLDVKTLDASVLKRNFIWSISFKFHETNIIWI